METLGPENGRKISSLEAKMASHQSWLEDLETSKENLRDRMARLETRVEDRIIPMLDLIARQQRLLDGKLWGVIVLILSMFVALYFKGGR